MNCLPGYTGFNSSSGLSKMVWFVHNFPAKADKINKWIHAADYIIGKLSGKWAITDCTNALKSGYDLQNNCWPSYICNHLPLRKEWLPAVVPSGTIIGNLDVTVASQLGLQKTVQVVAGMTDGCASQIASSAVNPGDWNTTIGTTLVVKGVTKEEIKDPANSLYNHRHPEGYWMPGGASNIGADWVSEDFKHDIISLNSEAEKLIPTGKLSYPLIQQGERFPFIAPDAMSFEPERLSGEKVKVVFTAGDASNSDVWLTIRSSVLNLPIYKMKYVTGAFGVVMLAASKTYFTSIIEATKALVQIEKKILPQQELVEQYNKSYKNFILLLQQKGYIPKESMLNIYLLRLGQTQYNAEENKYCGRTDIPLTGKGVQQAEWVREQLKDISFDASYSSPLSRAYTTAQIASGDKVVIKDDRLTEADFGQWEGKTKEEFIAENENLWNDWTNYPTTTKAGGTGETAKEVIDRVEYFLYHYFSNIEQETYW